MCEAMSSAAWIAVWTDTGRQSSVVHQDTITQHTVHEAEEARCSTSSTTGLARKRPNWLLRVPLSPSSVQGEWSRIQDCPINVTALSGFASYSTPVQVGTHRAERWAVCRKTCRVVGVSPDRHPLPSASTPPTAYGGHMVPRYMSWSLPGPGLLLSASKGWGPCVMSGRLWRTQALSGSRRSINARVACAHWTASLAAT